MQFFNRLEESIIALLLATMTLITFTQVIARYFFNTGFVWALELTTYLFAWLVLLGMSYGVRVGAHIGVDVVIRLLPRKGQQILAIIAALLGMGYCVLVFIGGWHYVRLIYQLDIQAEDVPVAQWIPYSVLPLGAALLFWRFGQLILNIIKGQRPHLLADEAQEALEGHTHSQDSRP